MAFLPRYAHRIPVVSQSIRRHEETYRRLYNRPLDYSQGWWTPPLPAADAWDLERTQIEQRGLEALVSLTDHDSIEAGLRLRVLAHGAEAPIALEWTIPQPPGFLHIGVHNLPEDQARSIADVLAAWTATPANRSLVEILEWLNSLPGVLLVLNHPLWDEASLGQEIHLGVLNRFLDRCGRFLHALELNGLRPWQENSDTLALARVRRILVVSGGDRHGCEPNALLNLSNASTFDEFVAEVRHNKLSHVLFMPQYRESMRIRCAQTMWDVLRDYPEYPGRVLWSDRIYFRDHHGHASSLTRLWAGSGPRIVRNFVGVMRVLESRRVRAALRFAFSEGRELEYGFATHRLLH